MNQEFIRQQAEKLYAESLLAGNIKGVAIAGRNTEDLMNGDDFEKFLGYKISLLEKIRISEMFELTALLEKNRKKLCEKCRDGLATFDIRCDADLIPFMTCEYVMRAMK